MLNYCKNLTAEKIVDLLCMEKFKKLAKIELESTAFSHSSL